MKPNLITYFIAVNKTPARALKLINATLGTAHTYSRLSEWKRGKRAVPEKVRRLMIEKVVPLAIASHYLGGMIVNKNEFFEALHPPDANE